MIEKICVCGAGTMGSGIAQIAAHKGFQVKLFDVNTNVLESAEGTIDKNLNYLVNKNRISETDKKSIANRIEFITQIEDCRADLIIEAIVERMDVKINLWQQLSAFNSDETIFATNTSSLSVSALQKEIKNPERFAGLHFFNPAYLMKLVEIVKGEKTNEATIEVLQNVCLQLDKTSVVCQDAPGFIVNRVARPYYLESLKIIENGWASFEELDQLLVATGFKMGPFTLMDLIGIDINHAVSTSLYEAMDQPIRLKPSNIQAQKVAEGNLGKKTGKGFYQY